MVKSRPNSSRRSYSSLGMTEVARSRVFLVGSAQKPGCATRLLRRSSGDMASCCRTSLGKAENPSTALFPPILRSSSRTSGPNSSQCPSASITGWLNCARTFDIVACPLLLIQNLLNRRSFSLPINRGVTIVCVRLSCVSPYQLVLVWKEVSGVRFGFFFRSKAVLPCSPSASGYDARDAQHAKATGKSAHAGNSIADYSGRC